MVKHIVFAILALSFLVLDGIAYAAASPEIVDGRATAAYWTDRNPKGEDILLSEAEVQAVNRAMREQNDTLHDLAAFPAYMSETDIRTRIGKARALGDFAEDVPTLYANGVRLSKTAYAEALGNSDPVLQDRNAVRYGLVLRRANLRLLPVEQGWFESDTDTHYDALQATALDPAEPVAILAESRDGAFAFVAARHYEGWLLTRDFAELGREAWLRYVSPSNFAVVTANKKYLALDSGERLLFQMGARIPLVPREGKGLDLCLPVLVQGKLTELRVPFREDGTIHHGWLPCTENNFVRQAFRFLGDEYGWGGLDDSVDCSAFVGDVYRSMGLELPRDADTQASTLPRRTRLDGMDETDRFRVLKTFGAGTLLSNATHVMMYLGVGSDGTPIVIQAMSSWFSHDGVRQKHYNRKVVVTTADFLNYRGVPYINGIEWIGAVR